MPGSTERHTFVDRRFRDVEVALPTTAPRVGDCSRFAVLMLGDIEVEVTDTSALALEDYFSVTGATPDTELVLSTGTRVAVGRAAPENGGGYCFGITYGSRALLGTVPVGVSATALAEWLGDLDVAATPYGLSVAPRRGSWSPTRTPSMAFAVRLPSGPLSLVDIRPAFRSVRRGLPGVRARGGVLSRVSVPDRPEHLVLNAPGHVVYVLPPSRASASRGAELDEVAALAAELVVTDSAG